MKVIWEKLNVVRIDKRPRKYYHKWKIHLMSYVRANPKQNQSDNSTNGMDLVYNKHQQWSYATHIRWVQLP